MHALGGDCTIHIKFFTYYASIMLDAFLYLLCSKLCQPNWLRPTDGYLATGSHADQNVLIPRIVLLPSSNELPFTLSRK